MLYLKLYYNKHLEKTFINNRIFKILKKQSLNISVTKKHKKIAVLKSPHVFSKFKQSYASSHFSTAFSVNYNFYNIVNLHKFIELDLPVSIKVKKSI